MRNYDYDRLLVIKLCALVLLLGFLLSGCTETTILAPSAPQDGCIWATTVFEGQELEGWMCPTLRSLSP